MTAGFRAAESTRASSERQRGVGDAPLAFAQDYALAQRAAEGEARAQKQLGQRLIARVRRAAQALMGGDLDADDAAQHALIELLRSARRYAGEISLESWADRLAARSLVRFARAVRARQGRVHPPLSSVLEGDRPERYARSLEEFLRELPSAAREALLLREAFGFDLVETAQLMRSSTRSARELLSSAYFGLYLRHVRADDASRDGLPESVSRWLTLRERAARSQAAEPARGADELSVEDWEELRALEAQAELRKLQRDLRGLVQFVEVSRFGRLSQRDKKLLEEALAAARVSSIGVRPVLSSDAERALSSELDDDGWVQPISLALCVVLVVGAFVALAMRAPQSSAAHLPAAPPRGDHGRVPTVEELSSAHAVDHGARLSRDGRPLARGESLREGDVVSAHSHSACFGLSPRADVCLSPASEAGIAQLSLSARRVELRRGRAVASVERVDPGVPFALSAADLRAETRDGVIALERDGEQVIVRVLRGTARVSTRTAAGAEERALAAAQSARYALASGRFELIAQSAERARRDWDLLATRAAGGLAPREASSAKAPAPAAAPEGLVTPPHAAIAADSVEEAPAELAAAIAGPPAELESAAPEPASSPLSPEELLARAKQASRAQRFAEAADLYQELIHDAPHSRGAREALVLRGELLSERLRMPGEALVSFDRYLASGGGLLDVRAHYGRILALRHLGRSAEEAAAVQQFLASYGLTPQARVLRARRAAEGPRP